MKVAVIAMPWLPVDVPRLSLPVLSRILGNYGVEVQEYHCYLRLLAYVPVDAMIPDELVYMHLFENTEESLRGLTDRFGAESVTLILRQLGEFHEDILRELDNGGFDAFLLSVTTGCFVSSLFLARQLKERHPAVPIVLGGPTASLPGSQAIVEQYPFVDMVVPGECERTVSHLLETLARKTGKPIARSALPTTLTLDDLGRLDYRPFFLTKEQLGERGNFSVGLPLELTRGCSWSACVFCNHNLLSPKYRRKKTVTVLDELTYENQKHGISKFFVVDNDANLNPDLWRSVANSGLKLEFFRLALRADASRDALQLLRRAGVRQLVLGVEFLSNRALGKMNKNITVMDALQAVRWSAELGFEVSYNIIINYPNLGVGEISECITNIKKIRGFPPALMTPLLIYPGSLLHKMHKVYGVERLEVSPAWQARTPNRLQGTFNPYHYSYGISEVQRVWFAKLKQELVHWGEVHSDGPPRNCMVSSSEVRNGHGKRHRVEPEEQRILTYCDQKRNLRAIGRKFASMDGLLEKLARLVRTALLIKQDDDYLSLVARSDRTRQPAGEPWTTVRGMFSRNRLLKEPGTRGP